MQTRVVYATVEMPTAAASRIYHALSGSLACGQTAGYACPGNNRWICERWEDTILFTFFAL